MNASELYAGNVFSSYRDMSKRLFEDEKPKTGKSRQLQLEDLKRYCEYHKEGNKYVVDLIYDIPNIKSDMRTFGNNNKYISLAREILLMTYIDYTTIKTSNTNLHALLGLFTNNYLLYRNGILDISIFHNNLTNNKKDILSFVNFLYHKRIDYLVPYMLKSMKKHNEILDYTHSVYYYQNDKEEWIEDDKNIVQKIMQDTKEFCLDCTSEHALHNNYIMNHMYYDILKTNMQKNNIYNYYRPYIISFSDTMSGINKTVIDDYKRTLNSRFVNELKQNIDESKLVTIADLKSECKQAIDLLFNIEYSSFVDKQDCYGYEINGIASNNFGFDNEKFINHISLIN